MLLKYTDRHWEKNHYKNHNKNKINSKTTEKLLFLRRKLKRTAEASLNLMSYRTTTVDYWWEIDLSQTTIMLFQKTTLSLSFFILYFLLSHPTFLSRIWLDNSSIKALFALPKGKITLEKQMKSAKEFRFWGLCKYNLKPKIKNTYET